MIMAMLLVIWVEIMTAQVVWQRGDEVVTRRSCSREKLTGIVWKHMEHID